MIATKCKTRILSLTILTLVAILAAFSPPSSHTPAYAQTQDTVVQRPGIPTSVSVSVIDHDSLRVSWAAAASGGTPTGYDLRYKAAGGDNWTTVANVSSPYTLDGLTPNTVYKVKVRAKNSAGASGWSDKGKDTTQTAPAPTPAPAPTLPGIPTSVSVSVIDHDSLRVSWAAAASGGTPTGYDLRYKVAANTAWTTVAGVTSPYTLNGLTPNTVYHVQVLARNSAGTTKSDRKKATTQVQQPAQTPTATPAPTLPGIPTSVSVSVIDHDSLRVSWAAAASGGTPTGYDLRYKVAANTAWTTVAGVTSPYTLNGLTPNTVYHVQVLARNSAGTTKSDRKKATTQVQQPAQTPTPTATPTLPGIPTSVSVSVIDHDSLRIAWSAPASGGTPTGYDLRYKVVGSDSWTKVENAASPRTLDGLSPNTKYTLQVRAKNAGGTSGWSNRTKGTTEATVTLPGIPAAPTVSVIDHDSLKVEWSAPASGGTPTGYDLRYKVVGSDSWTKVENAASPRSLDGLSPNTRYTVQVRAKNAGGTSGWSNRTKGTTEATVTAPGIPAAPTVSVIDHDSLKVEWSAPASGGTPTGYDLRYKVVGSNSWTKVENAASPRSLDGLSPNTRYTFQVRAKNAGGTSGWSNRTKGTTQATVTLPGIPAAPTVSVIDHDSLKVEWSAPTSGGTPTGYDLRYKVVGSDSWTKVENAASPRSLDGLSPNTKYTVQVRAKNAGGTSGWSNRTKGTTQAKQSELGPVGQVDEE